MDFICRFGFWMRPWIRVLGSGVIQRKWNLPMPLSSESCFDHAPLAIANETEGITPSLTQEGLLEGPGSGRQWSVVSVQFGATNHGPRTTDQ